MPPSRFEDNFSEEERRNEHARVASKYRDRVAVICQKKVGCEKLPEVHKRKYLVPEDITMAQFAFVIRKHLNLSSEQAIFFMVSRAAIPATMTMAQVSHKYRSADGFLYIDYMGENAFG